VRLEIDDDHVRRAERFPAVHDQRWDLDQPRALAAQDDRVDVSERRRVRPQVDQRHLQLATCYGELIGVAIVEVPAFHDAVVGRALIHMCGRHQARLFDPWPAPELDHVAAAVEVDPQILDDDARDGGWGS